MNDDEKDERGRDPIWDILKENAKAEHKARVAKNPERVQYAIEQFRKAGIAYELKNVEIGHFHCLRKGDGALFQFWASTGKIMGYDFARGIHSLIRLLEKACWIPDVDPVTQLPAHRCSACNAFVIGANKLAVCPYCLAEMSLPRKGM